jgi:hypothetical protein
MKAGVCITHGAKVKRCIFEGCTKYAQKGGVCITHGAKKHKRCSSQGCNNYVVKGGVCVTHGAKTKRCSHEGCTNQALKGGICVTHGARKKRCSFKECTNQVQKGGVCRRHGSKNINATNNNDVTPVIASRRLVDYDYEEEEELNSWIWRSNIRPSQYTIKGNLRESSKKQQDDSAYGLEQDKGKESNKNLCH